MALFNDLPNEILLDIFEYLRNSSSSGTLTNAMLCCRNWHTVVSSVFYNHVSVHSKLNCNSSSARFAKQLSYPFLVRSFRLNICQVHLMGFHIGFLKAQERMNEICTVLSSMENLRAFSLTLEDHKGQEYLLPSAAVEKVLKSLPQTVVDLNLDCGSLDTASSSIHICDALASVIPRLHRLRLRLSHLCSAIFSTLHSASKAFSRPDTFSIAKSTSELRQAIIRLDTRPDSVYGTNSRICNTRGQPFRARDLATALRAMYENDAFPFLRCLAVIDRRDAAALTHNEHWNVFKVRDVVDETTTTFPWCPRGGCSSLFMIRDLRGQDWFGSFTQITNALEGPLAWRRGLRSSKENEANGWNLDLDSLASREEVVRNYGVSIRLWKHEDLAGMRLLDARTVAGFDDVDAASEMLPSGWQWIPEGRWQWTIQRL